MLESRKMGVDENFTPYFYNNLDLDTQNRVENHSSYFGIDSFQDMETAFYVSGGIGDLFRIKASGTEIPVYLKIFHICDAEFFRRQQIISDKISFFFNEKSPVTEYLVPYLFIDGKDIDGNPVQFALVKKAIGSPVTLESLESMSRDSILKLDANFCSMITAFEKENIGISDLSPDNLIMNNDSLVLIDYDELYVPDMDKNTFTILSGKTSYRHHSRTPSTPHLLTPWIHNYAALEIKLCLRALAEDKILFQELRDRTLVSESETPLLFIEEDLVCPGNSQMIATLCRSKNGHIRYLAQEFYKYSLASNDTTPPLSKICAEYRKNLINEANNFNPAAMLELADEFYSQGTIKFAKYWYRKTSGYPQTSTAAKEQLKKIDSAGVDF